MSLAGAGDERIKKFLAALERQARAVRDALGDYSIARMAVGGGTPTLLSADRLHTLMQMTKNLLGVALPRVGTSVEVSPPTATAERIKVLLENAVHRVSIGVQSFVAEELRVLGRRQSLRQIEQSLELLSEASFPVFNIDLIYGIPGQSVESFVSSLRRALHHRPTELYIYPLYVRKLTPLAVQGVTAADNRLEMYRLAAELLKTEGFEQVSLRRFRRPTTSDATCFPEYSCQNDGMIGLGCGARSYTSELHYSGPYAVQPSKIKNIIDQYCRMDEAEFGLVDYGVYLNRDERRRRYLIKSLLQCEGLDCSLYKARFAADPQLDFPPLVRLFEEGLAHRQEGRIRLTEQGIELSDRIGPWLYSKPVRALMEGYQWG